MNSCRLVILLICLVTEISQAADFKISPLQADDAKKISAILRKQEACWVPAEELKKYPGLYWQDDLRAQSFRITSAQKGIEDSYFVPIQADYARGTKSDKQWSQSLSLLLIDRKTSTIRALPEHPVLQWNFEHIAGIAFRDLHGKGTRSILVDAAGATGVGPNGNEPFDVVAVYLMKEDGSWALDDDLQSKIDQQMEKNCKKAKCRDLETVAEFAKSYYKKPHYGAK